MTPDVPSHGVGPWTADAACLDADPDLFFPIGETGPSVIQIEEARGVCRECSVRAPCLTFALTTNVQHGVWAGTVPDERARLKRRGEIVGRPRSKESAGSPFGASRAP